MRLSTFCRWALTSRDPASHNKCAGSACDCTCHQDPRIKTRALVCPHPGCTKVFKSTEADKLAKHTMRDHDTRIADYPPELRDPPDEPASTPVQALTPVSTPVQALTPVVVESTVESTSGAIPAGSVQESDPAPAPVFACPECPRTFTSPNAVGPHRRHAHGGDGGTYSDEQRHTIVAEYRAAPIGEKKDVLTKHGIGAETMSRWHRSLGLELLPRGGARPNSGPRRDTPTPADDQGAPPMTTISELREHQAAADQTPPPVSNGQAKARRSFTDEEKRRIAREYADAPTGTRRAVGALHDVHDSVVRRWAREFGFVEPTRRPSKPADLQNSGGPASPPAAEAGGYTFTATQRDVLDAVAFCEGRDWLDVVHGLVTDLIARLGAEPEIAALVKARNTRRAKTSA